MPRLFDAAILRRKLAAFLGQSLFVQMWFVPVWLGLGLARAWVRLRPFRLIAPRLGRAMGAAPWVPLASDRQIAQALQISRVVRMAARYTPWTSDCYPQAIVARLLLGLHGLPYMLYFGVRRAAGATGAAIPAQAPKLEAHAWVQCGRMAVTGGPGFDSFTVVNQFVSPHLDGAIQPDSDALPPAFIGALARGHVDQHLLDAPRAATLARHGLAVAVVEALGPPSADTSQPVARLRQIRKRSVMRMMTVLATLHRVAKVLDQAKVRFLVIKGPALAVQTTGHWQGRPSTDIDLLIDPQDVARAHVALCAAGFHRRDGIARAPGALFRWANCEQPYEGGAVPVDLHWRMDASPRQADLRFADLWARAEQVRIDTMVLHTPQPVDAWLLTALHGAKSGWNRWNMLLDAHRQWQALDAAGRDVARARAAQAGCMAALGLAEALVHQSLPDTPARADSPASKRPGASQREDRIWQDRAQDILRATAGGHPPSMTAWAAWGRLRDAQRFAPDRLAAAEVLLRALGRVVLHPAAYRSHFAKAAVHRSAAGASAPARNASSPPGAGQ